MPLFHLDPEVKALLPRPSSEMFNDLKAQIKHDKHVEPGVVCVVGDQRFLGDGYTRYDICLALGIPFPRPREITFKTRADAIEWVIRNQLNRRNLTDEQRAYYRGKQYLHRKETFVGHADPSAIPGERMSETIGKEHNVSEKTIRRDAAFAAALDEKNPEEREEILSGESGLTRQEIIEGNREPGDDTEQEAEERRQEKAKGKNGREMFDWSEFYRKFNPIAQAEDQIVKSWPSERNCQEHKSAHYHLNEFITIMKAWQKRLTGRRS